VYDDAFWNVGKHSIKAGFAFQRIQSDFILAANPNGVFRFNTLADFLVNRPASLQVQNGALTPRALRQYVVGAYVEDDFRATQNLGINLGLRYEPASVPTEVHGKLANLRTLGSAQIYTGDPLFRNPTLLNFAPRVGAAWDPFGTGRTVVRTGFGLFDVLPLTYQFNLMQVSAAPFQATASTSSLPPGSFPDGAVSLVRLGGNVRTSFIQFEPKRNYVMQWNASVERDVSPNITVRAGYMGSRGVHNAMRTTDANGVIPSMTPDGLVWPCAGVLTDGVCSRPGGGSRFNTTYGQIDGQVWNGNSIYNALLLSARRRYSQGVEAQISFTWSRSEDTGSSVGSGGPFLNSVSGQFLFAPLRALSDFHVGRTLVASGTWDLPFGHTKPWGHWQVGTLLNISDGQPFTPLISGDALGQANQSLFNVPDRLDLPGCDTAVNPRNPSQYIKLSCFAFPSPSTRFGNAGRNSLIGPGVVTVDVSVIKNVRLDGLGSGARLQLRAELFNVTNRVNVAPPLANNRIFDATGTLVSFAGQITTLSTGPRQLQLGVKLLW
jgi:opacity protein-like surface antigen